MEVIKRGVKRVTIFLLLALTIGNVNVFAQEDQPDFRRNPTLPPFMLIKADSTKLTQADLARNKKTLIMLFSVDCNHCRDLTDSLITNIDKLRHVEILMTTYQPLEEMAAFSKKFNLEKYQNIKVGRDIRYFFTPFFEPGGLPFLALYNEKGMLANAFEGEVSIDRILAAFNANLPKTK